MNRTVCGSLACKSNAASSFQRESTWKTCGSRIERNAWMFRQPSSFREAGTIYPGPLPVHPPFPAEPENGRRRRFPCRLRKCTAFKLHTLQNHGDPLAHTDAHCAQRIATLSAQQLVGRSCYQPASTCAEWMPQRDRATVRVNLGRTVRHAELPQYGQCLRRESFVQFNHINFRQR